MSQVLLEHFETLAQSQGGVAKLRELVLELAVQGKLIRSSKGRTDWTQTTLGRSGITQTGTTPSTQEAENKGSYIPFIKPGDLKPSGIDYTGEGLSRVGLEKGRLIPRNSVLMVCIGGSIGKAALVDRDVSCNQQINAITPYQGIDARFLLCYMRSVEFQREVNQRAGQGTLPILSKSKWETILVAYPPLEEQRRIVEKVDQLMRLCDQLEQSAQKSESARQQLLKALLASGDWERVLEHLPTLLQSPDDVGELRKGLLQLAVEGRLVEQDSREEPADQLIERIAKGRGQIGDFDFIQAPFDLPVGWAWTKFTTIGELARGKSKHRPRNDPQLYANGKYPLVQTGDVARANKSITTYSAVYNEVGLAQSRLWPLGTLCITIAANIADSALLGIEACFPDSVVGFIPDKAIGSARYFAYFVKTIKENLQAYAPSTAQKNINLGILEEVLIPLPPLEEQKRIVAKVERLMALCDRLEKALEHSQGSLVAALSSAVAHAV